MTTNGDGPSRSETVVRAWEMSTQQGKSLRTIAAELGISLASASRYVREAEAAGEFVDLLDKREAKVGQALRFREYLDLLKARIDQGAKAELVIPVSMRVEDSLAKLHGTYAPTRVAVTDDREEKGLDPETIAAVREAQRRAAAERQDVGAPARNEG